MYPGAGFRDPTDVAAKRLGAAAIEFGSYFAVSQVMSIVTQGATIGFTPSNQAQFDETEAGTFVAVMLIGVVLPLVYLFVITVAMRAITGASLGQKLLGLVTVNERGETLGFGWCCLRALLGIVDGFPYCCYLFLVGGITMFKTPGHRRVGDMVCKSYVVPKEYLGQPLGPPEMLGRAGGPWGVAAGPWGVAAGSPGPGPSTPPAPEAQWDASRNTWIRWNGERWEGFDAATNDWRPL